MGNVKMSCPCGAVLERNDTGTIQGEVAISQWNEAHASCASLRERVERMEKNLRRYGTHLNTCDYKNTDICTCGLRAALAGEGEK